MFVLYFIFQAYIIAANSKSTSTQVTREEADSCLVTNTIELDECHLGAGAGALLLPSPSFGRTDDRI